MRFFRTALYVVTALCYPEQIPGQVNATGTLSGQVTDPRFVNPPIYTFGNAGRNVLIGPGLFTRDLGADKDFRMNERLGLQFRSEFFNVLNRANFGLPNGSVGSAAAGTITSVVTNARQIQFALRLHW